MRIPHFNKNCIFWDVAHIFLLGVARELLGSVLVLWAETGALQKWVLKTYVRDITRTRDGMDEGFKYLWAHCRQWCARHGMSCRGRLPFSLDKLSRQSKGHWPCIANSVKAMQVKNMLYWLADIAPEFQGRDDESYNYGTSAVVEAALWSAATWFHTLLTARSKTWLDGDECAKARTAGATFLKAYQWLSFVLQGEALFRVKPKFHYLAHIVEDTSNMNPISYMCLDMESFLGTMKKTGKGTHARSIMHRTVQRYLSFLHVRWANR
eukprot:10503060-Alexandrium_andersonii.AAC.1